MKIWKKIKKIKKVGREKTFDLEVNHPDHNFYAEGLVTSNSHSISYSLLAVYTLYFKWQYPHEFFLALLRMSLKEPKPHEEIGKISKELGHFGIELLRPDLIKSSVDFTLEKTSDKKRNIRFGLSAVKGLSEKSLQSIEDFQQKFTNKFEVFKSAKECGLNIGVLSSMIQAGVLDSVIPDNCPRAYMVLEAQVFNLLTDREKHYALLLGEEYEYDVFKFIKGCVSSNRKDAKGKIPIIKPSRWVELEKGAPLSEGGTIQKKSEKYLEIFLKNKSNHDLANWFFENELLGFVYSMSLRDVMLPTNRGLDSIEDFDDMPENYKTNFCGKVTDVSRRTSKKGDNMLKFTLSDNQGSLTCIFYGYRFDKWEAQNPDLKLKDENLVIIRGNKSKGDAIFINDLTILDNRAYLKLRDLK